MELIWYYPNARKVMAAGPNTHNEAFMSAPELNILQDSVFSFDARGVAKRFRHAAIFGALDVLQSGETMRFGNDHDPIPLLNQIKQRYGETFSIEYRSREPGLIVIDFTRK